MPPSAVIISEVGPRDGLQSVARTMPTAAKCLWIDALAAAGVSEIEVGSFVSPKRLPQMADTAEVVRHALRHPGLTVMALVPNLQGAEAAFAAGVHKLTVPVSASEAHSLANVRRTRAQMVDEVAAIVHARDRQAPGVVVEVGISTAFGCTLQGRVDEGEVLHLAAQLVTAGAQQVGLSDTTGMAHPVQVQHLFTGLRAAVGARMGGAHLHNTRGLGLANALAAWQVGVSTFDASLAGLGGCPYAPGASGNVVTEDLVHMFEAMGVVTGVRLDRLLAARDVLTAGLPGEPLYGMLAGVQAGARGTGPG
jgi:hydroxymethylglutaryl-CoA lyase